MASAATSLHLGTLHPVEQLLVLLLAFGPFVVLALVVRRQRRRAARVEDAPVEDAPVEDASIAEREEDPGRSDQR